MLNNAVIFLKKKLMAHFYAAHEVILISSSSLYDSGATLFKGPIKDLEILLKHVSFDSSLFIPGVLPKAKQINKEFFDFITKQVPNTGKSAI